MKPLYDLLDLYCRSALGSLNPDISAFGYSNFYISELEPRFSSPYGNGVSINNMVDTLKKRT